MSGTRDGDVDYSTYGVAELEEAIVAIDRQRYPKNYANLRAAYRQLTNSPPPAGPVVRDTSSVERDPAWSGPRYANGRYVPNDIPSGQRVLHVVGSLLLFAYGTYGVWVNDLAVPGKRRVLHLHDVPAWIMYGAILCACVVMLSVVFDHYDRRDNEKHYRAIAKSGEVGGWSFFCLSLVWAVLDAF